MANKADKEKMLEEIEDRVRTIGVLQVVEVYRERKPRSVQL